MSRPHVAIDARCVQGDMATAGVGRALAHVLPLLAQHPALDGITLLTDAASPPTGLGLPEVALRSPVPRYSAAWLQVSAPRWLARHRDVIFHCSWYGLPYRQPTPMTATLHDILFEHRPEWYPRSRLAVFRAQARQAARTARRIVTPSRYVKDDIVATYGYDADRIVLAPHAPDPIFRPDAISAASLPAPADGYVVAIAGATRRRADIAVAAWQRTGSALPLVVIGTGDVPSADGVIRLGRLSDEAWAACLAGARALLYPTEAEGFGLPALEAMASGTPVVCARVDSLPEVLGDDAAWAADATIDAYADALRGVLDDDVAHARLREAGLARASREFSWQRSADAHALAMAAAAG